MRLYDHLLQGYEKSWSQNKKREVETQKELIPGSSQSTPPQNLVVQLHLPQLVLHQPSASCSRFFYNLHSLCFYFSYLWQTRWCSGCSPPLDGCSAVADTLQAGTCGLSRVGRRELFPCTLHDLLWAPGASLSGQRAGSEAAALPSGKPRQLCLLARQVVWLRQCPEHAFASLSYVNNTSGIRPFVHILTCKVRIKWGERNRGAELSGQWQRDLGEGSCGWKWRLIFLEKLYNEGEIGISDIYVTLRELTPHCSWVALAEFMLCVYTKSPLSAHLRETLSLSGSALKNKMQK